MIFLLANVKERENLEEGFLPFVGICFRSRDMSFQSIGRCEKKIEHLVPLQQKF